MAKRYGRRQRRQHLDRIAELERRLCTESTALLFRAHDGVANLENTIPVLSYDCTESGRPNESVECAVCLTVDANNEDVRNELVAAVYDQRRYVFRGKTYIVVDAQVPMPHFDDDDDVIRTIADHRFVQTVELQMRGVA